MLLETEINGICYALYKEKQVAMVKKCVNMERKGEVIIPAFFLYKEMMYEVIGIGDDAFEGCINLASITIPESVTSIGEHAFYGCNKLSSITIPKEVNCIAHSAFRNCISLVSIIVSTENNTYDSRENCNAIIETYTNTLIIGCSATIIPNDVMKIGDFAFWDCRNLLSITIPNNVRSIGEWTFLGCTSLKELILKDGCDNLSLGNIKHHQEQKPFLDCPLETIYWGRNLTCKGSPLNECSPFSDKSELTSVVVGGTVIDIGKHAFKGCENLSSISISNGIKSIGIGAFLSCHSLMSISLPESLVNIKESAFYDCCSLNSIIIPENVISIKSDTFLGCTSLTSITLPKSITNIGEYAFYKCSNLQHLTLFSCPTIDENAFDECIQLTNVYCYSEEVPSVTDAFGDLDLSTITLHVPENAMEKYNNTIPWCHFGKIVSIKQHL